MMATKFKSEAQRKAVMSALARQRQSSARSMTPAVHDAVLDMIGSKDDGDGAYITDVVKGLAGKISEAEVRSAIKSMLKRQSLYIPQWYSSDRVKVL